MVLCWISYVIESQGIISLRKTLWWFVLLYSSNTLWKCELVKRAAFSWRLCWWTRNNKVQWQQTLVLGRRSIMRRKPVVAEYERTDLHPRSCMVVNPFGRNRYDGSREYSVLVLAISQQYYFFTIFFHLPFLACPQLPPLPLFLSLSTVDWSRLLWGLSNGHTCLCKD